jgi:hypothetical protein
MIQKCQTMIQLVRLDKIQWSDTKNILTEKILSGHKNFVNQKILIRNFKKTNELKVLLMLKTFIRLNKGY